VKEHDNSTNAEESHAVRESHETNSGKVMNQELNSVLHLGVPQDNSSGMEIVRELNNVEQLDPGASKRKKEKKRKKKRKKKTKKNEIRRR
jgi:hypothetical protein